MEFEVTAPDGRRFRVTAPQGATQADVLAFAQREFARMGEPAAERGVGERAMAAAGQFGAGVNTGLASAIGGPFDLVNRGLRAVGVPIPEGSVTGMVQRGINAVVGEPPAPQGMVEELARGAGRGLVDAGATLLPAAGLARALPAGVMQGAAASMAAQPIMQAGAGMVGGAVGEATDNPLLGAAAAIATPALVGAARRVITPVPHSNSPQRAALVTQAEAEGIPLTAGQATGSRFLQNVESQLEQLPLTSAPQRAIREEQQRAFNRAVLQRAGVNADVATPEVMNAARDRIGGEIGAIANRNTLVVTPQLQQELAQIDDSLRFLPAEAAAPVRARLEQLRGMVMPGTPIPPNSSAVPGAAVPDTIPGASYRMLDSQLGRSMRSTANGDLRAALGDLRERLRAAMDASISPEDAQAWQEARRQYANLMVAARAAGGAGANVAEGNISPLALRGAVNQSTGQGYAFGRGDLNELARIGQSLLRAPPDSGTAGRSAATNVLTAGGGIAGTVMGGPIAGAAAAGATFALPRLAQLLMNSPAGQAYLRNQIAAGPGYSGQLAAALLAQQANARLNAPTP